jgi:hypothetical protein
MVLRRYRYPMRRKGETSDAVSRRDYPHAARFLDAVRHSGLVEGAWWYGEAAPRLIGETIAGTRYVLLCFKEEGAARRCAGALQGGGCP